ncbi:Uncharacterised protein [Candidatus Anstonella stagnisolia]|nr:Uncharacterised protein [Candidatus Anstonella stagnisolia]
MGGTWIKYLNSAAQFFPMKTSTLFIALLFLFSAAFAFSASDYVYPSEQASSITSVDFKLASAPSSSFTLVTLSGSPIFLLKDGEPVRETAKLTSYIGEYYQSLYPSSDELSELKGYFIDFNKSRDKEVPLFKGSPTKYKPETMCRQSTGLASIGMCDSQSRCNALAGMICTLYEGTNCDPNALGNAIFAYAKAVGALDKQSTAAFAALNSMDSTNMNDKLTILTGTIQPMKDAADALKHSVLRLPTTDGDICAAGACRYGQSCWAECSQLLSICPSEILDVAKLDSATTKMTSIQLRIANLAQPEVAARQLALATNDRISYKQNAALASDYGAKYSALKSKYSATLEKAQNVTSLVDDPQLSEKFSALTSAGEAIELAISSKNFAQIDSQLSKYSSASEALKVSLARPNITASYDVAANAQDDAGDALLQASWSVNPASSNELSDYNKLVQRMRNLDGNFQPPLTNSQYANLTANYARLSSDAKQFLASSRSPQELAMGVGTTVSATSVDGAMSIMNTVVPVTFKARQQFSPVVLPVVLLLTDASVLSIILVVFVFSLIYMRHFFSSKIVLACWIGIVVLFTGFVLVGSLGLFYAMQNSSISTFGDFYSQVKNSPKAIIIVDPTGADEGAKASMLSCADTIKSQLRALNNITSSQYVMSGSICTLDGKALSSAACADIPNLPIFNLKYSALKNSVQFTVVAEDEATITGNGSYYTRCDIGNVLN